MDAKSIINVVIFYYETNIVKMEEPYLNINYIVIRDKVMKL